MVIVIRVGEFVPCLLGFLCCGVLLGVREMLVEKEVEREVEKGGGERGGDGGGDENKK